MVKGCLVIKNQIHTPNLKLQRVLKCKTPGVTECVIEFCIAFKDGDSQVFFESLVIWEVPTHKQDFLLLSP